MCMSVDLPEPEGPMTAVSLPRSTSRLTPQSALTAVSPSPYTRLRSRAETTGSGVPVRASSVAAVASSPIDPAPSVPSAVTRGKEGRRGQHVSADEHGALEPRGAAVGDEERGQHRRAGEDSDL